MKMNLQQLDIKSNFITAKSINMAGIKTSTKDLGKSFEKLKSQIRDPKYMGCGIHVHLAFRADELVPGDTFHDADYGAMIWTGKKWVSDDTGNLK